MSEGSRYSNSATSGERRTTTYRNCGPHQQSQNQESEQKYCRTFSQRVQGVGLTTDSLHKSHVLRGNNAARGDAGITVARRRAAPAASRAIAPAAKRTPRLAPGSAYASSIPEPMVRSKRREGKDSAQLGLMSPAAARSCLLSCLPKLQLSAASS